MQSQKLTSGQKIALSTFLSSYDENCSFKKLLAAIHSNDFEVVTIWEQIEHMNIKNLIEAIKNLSANIDAVLKH